MTIVLSLVVAVIASLSVTTQMIHFQGQSAPVNHLPSKSRRPTVSVVRQTSSPVTLKVTSVQAITGKPGFVRITIKAQGASTVKGYHFHYEEAFVDKYGAAGSVETDSTSLRSLNNEESFIAHENGEVKVWVSVVEFLDQSTWKSVLTPKAKKEG
jgi:hypothetical protein